MTVAINVGNFDPMNFVGPGRLLSGPIQSGAVTYDTDYGTSVFARWIYVGTMGDLAYMKWDGTTETLPNLAAGVWHPIFSLRILSSGTTIAANQLRWGA